MIEGSLGQVHSIFCTLLWFNWVWLTGSMAFDPGLRVMLHVHKQMPQLLIIKHAGKYVAEENKTSTLTLTFSIHCDKDE